MAPTKSVVAKLEESAQPSIPDFPDVFSQRPVAIQSRSFPPFVHIAQPKATEFWTKLASKFPGLAEGEAFLFLSEGNIKRLQPCKFHLLQAAQFWVRCDQQGNILEVKTEDPRNQQFKERICTVLAVYDGENLIPANAQFRSTKASAIHAMFKWLQMAATPEWGQQSPAHAKSLAAPKPFMRFYGVAAPRRKTGKTGRAYTYLEVDRTPSTEVEWHALGKARQDPTFVKTLTDVGNYYQNEVAELEKKAASPAAAK